MQNFGFKMKTRGGIIIESHACIELGKDQIRLGDNIDIWRDGTMEKMEHDGKNERGVGQVEASPLP